jgi:hypothetical protein
VLERDRNWQDKCEVREREKGKVNPIAEWAEVGGDII